MLSGKGTASPGKVVAVCIEAWGSTGERGSEVQYIPGWNRLVTAAV